MPKLHSKHMNMKTTLSSKISTHFVFAFCTILVLCLPACTSNQKPREKDAGFPFLEYDIAQVQLDLAEGNYTSEILVKAYLDRIRDIDLKEGGLHSIISVNPDALEIATKLDKERQEGKLRGPMHGIPVVLKDNIDTYDKMPTTAGSRALKNSYPAKDSFVAKKLREAGAIILAKANLSEWANFRGEPSSSGWSGVGGQTHNPYDLSRNPCGSSSGSAVAVSANLTMVAIGTETNGSIVCPSHANGIVGLKPTVGLVSRSGIIPISFTHDTPGPMTRTVKDAAITLGALVGVDSSDYKTFSSEGNYYNDYTAFLNSEGLKGKRIGRWIATQGINSSIDSIMELAYDFMESQGAEIVDVKHITDSIVYELSFKIMLYEFKDGINKYLNNLGDNVPVSSLTELIEFNKNDSIELKYFDQVYLEMANKMEDLSVDDYAQTLIKLQEETQSKGIDRVMNKLNLDVIAAPTGSPAWETDWTNGDDFTLSSSSPAAQAGYPNITVPAGWVGHLPVGISFFGKKWSEPVLLEVAYAFEQGTKYRQIPHIKSIKE